MAKPDVDVFREDKTFMVNGMLTERSCGKIWLGHAAFGVPILTFHIIHLLSLIIQMLNVLTKDRNCEYINKKRDLNAMCILFVNWHSLATLTEVSPCFFLSCKANARVYLAKTGHGPHSS
jgi:hypothetical protein